MTIQKVRILGQVALSIIKGDAFEMVSDVLQCDRTNGNSVILFDCHIAGMHQTNSGNATGFQTVVTGGSVTFVGMMNDEPIKNDPPAATLIIPRDWQGEIWIEPNSTIKLNTTSIIPTKRSF